MVTNNDWATGERIANIPIVDDALRGFSEDPTGDNGVCVVIAVLDAAAATSGSEPADDTITITRDLLIDYRNQAFEQGVIEGRDQCAAIAQQAGAPVERDDRMWDTNTVMSYLATLPGALDRTRANNVDDVLNALILMDRELPAAAPAPAAEEVRLLTALERLLERFLIVYGEPASGAVPHEVTIAQAAIRAAKGAAMSASQGKTEEAK